MNDADFPEYHRLTVDEAIRQLEARMLYRLERTKSIAWSLADITACKVVLTELKRLRDKE